MKKKHILNILIVLSLLLLAFSVFQIIRISLDYKKSQDEYQSVFERAVKAEPDSLNVPPDGGSDDASDADLPLLKVDFKTLKELNSDYVGWLEAPGTAINYPMVYYPDNDHYLRRTFLGSYNTAGSVFLDARTGYDFDSDHLIIYGHRMNDGSMFSDLKNYFDPAFCAENRMIHIYIENECLTYEIFAVREVSVEDACYTFSFASKEQYGMWLAEMKSLSSVATSLQPESDRSTITLSTCVLNKADSRNIIQAQLVDRRATS